MRRPEFAHGNPAMDLDMTPMIDVVFMLLVFFLLTFKILVPEGDFNVKMPRKEAIPGTTQAFTPPITVTMQADSRGGLALLSLGERRLWSNAQDDDPQEGYDRLRREIREMIGSGPVESDLEITFDCSENLAFDHTVRAVTAASGYIAEDGSIRPLAHKIKFAPVR